MLSIIVPFYNSEKYLFECLNSIFEQEMDDFEVVLVDDGSTDRSKSIAKNFERRFKNCAYYYKDNGGLMSAYLFGLNHISGDYVGFVDSDDLIHKKMFLLMYSTAKKNDADIVMCDLDHFAVQPLIKERMVCDGIIIENIAIENVQNNIFPTFAGKHIVNSRVNKIFKRSLVEKILKYLSCKSRYFEDRFFTVGAVFNAHSFYYIKCPLYFVRKNAVGESNSTRTATDLYDGIKNLAAAQKEILIDVNLFQVFEYKYEIACLNHLSLYIDRNIIYPKQSLKERIKFARQIIKDKFYIDLVKKHKKELIGKKGFLIKISYFFHSALLLGLLSKLKKC